MKLAVLGDVHGNAAALEAVIDHAERAHVDGFVVIGDTVVGAPDSLACWERVRTLGCPVVRGNHERYVTAFADEPAWQTPQFAPVAWAVAQLGECVQRELEALPVSFCLPDTAELLFVHASLRSDRDTIDMYTTETALAAMFPALSARYVVRGHNHFAATRAWKTHRLITNGSVGIPLGGVPKAQYLILEKHRGDWQPTFYSVSYDVDATLKRFHETGYLEQTGPIAHLFYREIATATLQLTPFLHHYQTLFTKRYVEPRGVGQGFFAVRLPVAR